MKQSLKYGALLAVTLFLGTTYWQLSPEIQGRNSREAAIAVGTTSTATSAPQGPPTSFSGMRGTSDDRRSEAPLSAVSQSDKSGAEDEHPPFSQGQTAQAYTEFLRQSSESERATMNRQSMSTAIASDFSQAFFKIESIDCRGTACEVRAVSTLSPEQQKQINGGDWDDMLLRISTQPWWKHSFQDYSSTMELKDGRLERSAFFYRHE